MLTTEFLQKNKPCNDAQPKAVYADKSPSSKYEKPDEDTYDRIYQVAGEIVMLDTIMFSLSLQKGSNYEKDIVNAVHWVYKTAVHGKVSGSKMHKKIMEILAK